MSKVLFKRRRYRAYFELVESLRHEGCPLCHLLSKKEREAIPGLLSLGRDGEKKEVNLAALCFTHRVRAKELLTGEPEATSPLKKAISEELKEMIGAPRGPRFPWRRRLGGPLGECPLCRELHSKERFLCDALIDYLEEMEFWKELQAGSLLCLDHLRKCMMTGSHERGFRRLVQDQASKLNSLLDRLIRLENAGGDSEGRVRVLEWLADSQGVVLRASPVTAYSLPDESPADIASHPEDACSANGREADPETLRFENEKLKRKIDDLVTQLGRVESRAAALHYRAAELGEVNKRLEMGYTGANALANGLEKLVRDLKEEIARLKAGGPENSSKPV